MKRVKKIGNIKLDNHLFWAETFELKNVKGTTFNTLAGGRVVFETQKRNTSTNITLDSKDYGWQLEDTIKKIMLLADDLDVTTTITFTDDTEIEARFRVEENEVIKVEPKYEGSKWYNVTIKMAKV
jgi:hypothetical protein